MIDAEIRTFENHNERLTNGTSCVDQYESSQQLCESVADADAGVRERRVNCVQGSSSSGRVS